MSPAAVKAPVWGPALNNCIVPGLLINVKGAEEQFQQCYQEQTEGDKGPSSSAGAPINGSLCCMAMIHTAGVIVSDVFLFTYMCVCACAHSWDGGNCISVFTP